MVSRLASACVGLVLLTLASSGCFNAKGDGVFGPASSLGGDENSAPALSMKATPARGPGPLEVEFSLSARDRDGDALSWALDFGDRTAPAAGTDLPAKAKHTYKAPGAYVATFKVKDRAGESVSTLTVVVLEGIVSKTGTPSPTQGPEPPQYQPPPPPPPSGGGGGPPPTSSASNSTTASNTTTSSASNSTTPEPTPTPTSSSTSSSGSTTAAPPPTSTSSSTSDTGTSSSTDTETFSDPGTSTSDTGTASDTGTTSS
ncbi:MAG: cytochrome c, partial [Thermoplasmata archaeon]|nr:cytochrome c [Thermoplasmata archaeon]